MSNYDNFLKSLVMGKTHALTITLKFDSVEESKFARRLRFEETIRHLIHRIERLCFRKLHRRNGLRIGVVVVVEDGTKNERMHAHLALQCPVIVGKGAFENLVIFAISKCKTLGGAFALKPITHSDGWAQYLAKDGPSAFFPQCTQHSNP